MGTKYRTEYDPLTGITSRFYDEGDGSITVNQTQDISDAVAYAKECRINGGAGDRKKDNWHHYAIIPPIVMHEMYQQGIDVARDGKAVFEFINKNYPALKVTDKWHDDRRAGNKEGRILVT